MDYNMIDVQATGVAGTDHIQMSREELGRFIRRLERYGFILKVGQDGICTFTAGAGATYIWRA